MLRSWSLAVAAASCLVAAFGARPCQAQSAKLAKPVPEWGVNAAIESDLLRAKPAKNTRETPARKQRVLLVGNSYTNFNLLNMLIERLAEASGGPRLQVEVEARPGYSLRMHLKSRTVLNKIRNGNFSHVVLQGHSLSAIDHPDELAEDAERLASAIHAAGSRTVMYETWARKPQSALYKKHARVKTFDQMFTQINTAYSGIAERLQIGLAPVGTAFERAWRENPGVPLWGADGSHPTLAGSYMAACVIYGAVTGRDPRDATWEPYPLDRKLAENIRSVAAASLSGVPAALPARELSLPSQAVASESKAGRKGDSKSHRNAKSQPAGQVAASIAAFLGRAPGEVDAPATSLEAAGTNAPAERTPAAPVSPAEDAPMLPVPVRERSVQPEKASFIEEASVHSHVSSDLPLVAF